MSRPKKAKEKDRPMCVTIRRGFNILRRARENRTPFFFGAKKQRIRGP